VPVAVHGLESAGGPHEPSKLALAPWTHARRAPWRAASEMMWVRKTPTPRSTMPIIRVVSAAVVITASTVLLPWRFQRFVGRRMLDRSDRPLGSAPASNSGQWWPRSGQRITGTTMDFFSVRLLGIW